MRQKRFVLFLIMLTVVFLGVIGYFISQNTTAGWKTYTDKNITFRYPFDWEVSEPYQYNSSSETEFTFKYGKPLYIKYHKNINQNTGSPYLSLEDYLSINLPNIEGVSKDIKIDNQSAKYISSPGVAGYVIPGEKIIFFTPTKADIIIILFQSGYFGGTNNKETIHKIISTLKFIQ
jgi:hypothetical protein